MIGEDNYTAIVLGDVTGNGTMDSADLLAIQRHLIGKVKIIDKNYLKASDTTKNGTTDSADLLAIQRHLLKKVFITI